MKDSVQISAVVSQATKELLDREARETGVKLNHLIETALRHHLQALHELPADVMVPARLVVSRESWDDIVASLERPGAPTPAMRELMASAAAEPRAAYRSKTRSKTPRKR